MLIEDVIKEGGKIIKNPFSKEYFIKCDDTTFYEIRNKYPSNTLIRCYEENTLDTETLKDVLADLTSKYNLRYALYSFHPLITIFLLVLEGSIDVKDFIENILTRTGIVRGIICVNDKQPIFFEKGKIDKKRTALTNKNKIIDHEDIIDLKIILNTTSSIEELLEKI